MKIKTASDLKYAHESAHPESHYFTRASMRFFGDTMRNYGVRETTVETYEGETIRAFELYRRRPVKHGLKSSHYFHPVTLDRIHPNNPPR